ncbi:ATP-binding protein [Actinoplanes sp. NPDC024001]|uniref:ATP-binding protein n=1 Tax=Actinoplanes sp. NPDC024001 TaxID=3154598 RepID=UPI0033C62BF3
MGQLQFSPPPPQAELLHVWVLNSQEELRGLRLALQQALSDYTSTAIERLADVPDRMVLVATELATNAIKYGRPPTEVRLLHTDDQFVVEVVDGDVSTVPELVDTRPVNAGGRGLLIAQSFSLNVGWYATETTKNVWAAFPMRPEP